MPEWVLVSGGTSGIGSALCRQLSGLAPLVGYRSQADAATRLANSCGGAALRLDLTSQASIDAAVETVTASHLPLRGVVLAASPPPTPQMFTSSSADDLAVQLAVNVTGPFLLLRSLIRRVFARDKQGFVVVLLSSALGLGDQGRGAKGMSTYITAKFGLLGLVRAAQFDYPWLAVHCESPYFTDTPMLQAFDEQFLATMRSNRPFERPEDVAGRIAQWIRQLP